MRMLLINQNPIVSKLVNLSAQKAGYEVVEELSPDEVESGEYEVLFIDDAQLNGLSPEELRDRLGVKKVCLIYADETGETEGFDYTIKKPFLPTEMVDLMSEIKEDLSLPEMEETEEGVPQSAAEESAETVEEESAEDSDTPKETEESLGEEDLDALLEELEAEEGSESEAAADETDEGGKEETDFDALLEELEAEEEAETAEESEPGAASDETRSEEADFDALLEELEAEGAKEGEEPEKDAESAAGEPNLPDETDLADLDALLEETDGSAREEEAETEVEFDELLEGLDLEELEEDREEPVSLPEPDEETGGVLDDALVSEVKELLDEETSPGEKGEEEELFADLEEPEEFCAEGEEVPEEPEEGFAAGTEATEEPKDAERGEEPEPFEEAGGEAGTEEKEESLEEAFGEFDALSEEALIEALGERPEESLSAASAFAEPAPAPEEVPGTEAAGEPEEKKKPQEHALISTLLGMDPEALRKLLAGAQITINITFPKEV